MASRKRSAADACEGQLGSGEHRATGAPSSRPPSPSPARDWKALLLLGPKGLLTGLAAPGTRTAQYFWLALASVAIFGIAFGLHLRAEISIERAHEERFESYRLAEELRQPSNDLTRMIRTYVATGDPIYKAHYQEILDVRDGRRPRPLQADNVYWDLVLGDDQRPRPNGEAAPLLQLMRRAGFTDAEFAKLAEAKAASDTLTKTEYAAMALVESRLPTAEASRTQAIRMLSDGKYHRSKADIMRPIGEFQTMVSTRTLAAVRAAEGHGRILRLVLVLSGLALVILFWCLLRAIQAEKRIKQANEAELTRYRSHLEQLVRERTAELTQRNRQLTEEVGARERAVAALNASESRFRFIAENTRDVIWMLDVATGRFSYVSPSVQEQRGFTPEEVMSQPMDAALTAESADRMRELMAATVSAWKAGERPHTLHVTDLEQPHRDGHVIGSEVLATLHGDSNGNLASVVGVTRDVTERKRAEDTVRRLAFYDGLTALPNRRLMTDRLEQSIARARREGSRVSLLFLDLDKFKPVNDQFGHHTGDWLLQVVAQRITECLRETDTAARLGGDEFVVVLPSIQSVAAAITVASRIHASLEVPFTTSRGERIEISSCIGIACYPDHADNAGGLLRAGDRAMYRAKRNGGNQVRVLSRGEPSSVPPEAVRGFGLQWDASYACGNPTIDAEHRKLFSKANRLLDAAALSPTDASAYAPAFEELLRDVAEHFRHEEDVLRAAGYSGLAQHAAQHRKLLRRALSLGQQVQTGQATVGELVDFLAVELVREHIARDDREYFPVLARRQPRHHPSQSDLSL